MAVKSIMREDESDEHLSEVTLHVPYKGVTIVARIPIGHGEPLNDKHLLRAVLTGVCAELCNQALQVAGHVDEGRLQNYHETVP